jgi:lipopolysaccharide exporter
MPPVVPASSRSSSFGVNVLTLVTGTTIAQIITILASPIITRLYGPETFGLLALFTSITSIIGVIACMRYELAIMLPKSDEEAANVFGLSIIFVIIVSAVTIPFLILLQQPVLLFLKAPQLGPFLWLIPLVILVSGIYLALEYWNTRTKHFHRQSIARVMRSSSTTGTQLGLGFFGYASGGALIGASILGQMVASLTLGIQIMRDHLSFFKQNITWNGMYNALKRYNKFLKYDIWSALLNTISWQIPIFLLSYFFTTAVVGYYSLGMTVIQLPMSYIGSAIGQVFYQRAAEAFHQNKLSFLVTEVFDELLKLSMFPMLVLTISGKDLFLIIFGPNWGEAGVYVQILSIWAIFWFISSPLSTIITVREKLKLNFKLTLLNFSTRLISLVIGGIIGSVFLAVALFSFSGVLIYGLACFIFLRLADIPVAMTFNMIMKRFFFAVPFLIPLIMMKVLSFSAIMITLMALAVSIAYGLFIFLTTPKLHNFIMDLTGQILNKI